MVFFDLCFSWLGLNKLNIRSAFWIEFFRGRLGQKICAFLLMLAVLSLPITGWAQAKLPSSGSAAETSIEIPEVLTPEIINGLVSRLTDAEIRATLLEELQRQAAEQAAAAKQEPAFFMAAEDRLSAMFEAISTRIVRWADRLSNLHTRMDTFRERLGSAESGAKGMVLSVLILVGVSIAVSRLVALATGPVRKRLTNVSNMGYWSRLSRTFALGLIELLPIFAFTLSTQLLLPFLLPSLGPMKGMVWIYTTGVWWGWIAVVVSRRAFAPYNKEIRITALSDDAATSVHGVLKHCVQVGLAGWLIAGIFLNLGFGFPPAIVTVAVSGMIVIIYLLYRVICNIPNIQNAVQNA